MLSAQSSYVKSKIKEQEENLVRRKTIPVDRRPFAQRHVHWHYSMPSLVQDLRPNAGSPQWLHAHYEQMKELQV